MRATTDLIDDMLAAAKTQLDGGKCYLFAGPVPSTADDALDMVSSHTQIAVLTESNDGTTGLTFEAAAAGVLAKDALETWEGLIAFSGVDASETTLTPTFFRFCKAGDDGRAAGSGKRRLQGSAGGPASSAVAKLTSTTATANGTNTIGIAIFNFRLLPGS